MTQQSSVNHDKTTLNPIIISISNWMASISRWMAVLACLTLALMMLAVTIDVFGRDIFNVPLEGTVEIVGLLLILASTWGMGLCQMEKHHLRIPLIYDLFPQRVRLWLDLLAYVVFLVTSSMITWEVLVLTMRYYRMPFGNVSEILALPFVPFLLVLAWGFAWLSLVLLLDIYKTWKEIMSK